MSSKKKIKVGANQKIVTEDEMKKLGGQVYDKDEQPFLMPHQLPDPEYIIDSIIAMLEVMVTPAMKNLKKTDDNAYENIMEEKFPEFSMKYYSLFKMVLSGSDIQPLFIMLTGITKAKNGTKTLEHVEKDVGKELSKFIPDNIKK